MIQVKAKGDEGLEEMKDHLSDDEILFGFLSLLVHDTQKFVFLTWIGENTPFSLRAGLIYNQANISNFFQVVHHPPPSSPITQPFTIPKFFISPSYHAL